MTGQRQSLPTVDLGKKQQQWWGHGNDDEPPEVDLSSIGQIIQICTSRTQTCCTHGPKLTCRSDGVPGISSAWGCTCGMLKMASITRSLFTGLQVNNSLLKCGCCHARHACRFAPVFRETQQCIVVTGQRDVLQNTDENGKQTCS